MRGKHKTAKSKRTYRSEGNREHESPNACAEPVRPLSATAVLTRKSARVDPNAWAERAGRTRRLSAWAERASRTYGPNALAERAGRKLAENPIKRPAPLLQASTICLRATR